MKRLFILLLSLTILSGCAAAEPDKGMDISSSSSEVLSGVSNTEASSKKVSDSAENNPSGETEPETEVSSEIGPWIDGTDPDYQFSSEVGIDGEINRYFALFEDWADEEKAGLEMPYSFQWIMPYIQFDDDLYEYIRTSERYSEWQEYETLGYQDGREYQPTLYDVVRFFGISREEFEALYADHIIPDAEWEERRSSGNAAVFSLSESMVDALFDGGTYTRNSLFCAKESAFVAAADGEVYSGFWMLYNTPAEALESASFTPEELTHFVETLRVPYAERDESDISADYANYAMAEPLQEFVEEWYAEYMALAGETL